MDLSAWIERWADFQPAKCAVHFAGRDRSYGEMAARIRRLAAALKHELGIGRCDRVAYLGMNSPDMLELLFACARLGAMLVPLNWRLAAPEHRYMLQDCGAAALFAEPEFLAQCAAIRAAMPALKGVAYSAPADGWLPYQALVDAAAGNDGNPHVGYDDAVLLVYTSGTTGRPKGAVLTQNALFFNAVNATHAHDLSSADHVLTTLPMFHVGGLNIQTLPALHAGASVTLHRRFDPAETLAAIAGRKPSLTLMVPATMAALLQHPDFPRADLGSLRLIMAGSSNIPAALIQGFHARGIPVGQVYGSTETAPIAIYLRAADAFGHVGSTGKPAIHCEVRIVDAAGAAVRPGQAGEILVRGANLFRDYWGDSAATQAALQDGWYHTGDIGHQDPAGFVTIDDRKKDLIISGGENIYPAELENVLADCPEIAEAAVVGAPDPRWGEVAVAIVVRKPGSRLDAAAVLSLFDGRLARFKHPRAVLFRDTLPRNVMGKVLKFEIRREIGEGRTDGINHQLINRD